MKLNLLLRFSGAGLLFLASFACVVAHAQSAQPMATYVQRVQDSNFPFTMVAVKGGEFLMGAAANDKSASPDEKPATKVTVSSFWMSEHEVTYDEYDVFFRDANFSTNQPSDAVTRPSPPYIDLTLGMGKEGGFPANSMSQYGAIMYCKWLYKKTGEFYRLPTEAEWEYACRAGSPEPTGAELDKFAWYEANSGNKYHKVGEKSPNAWGLYDMHGNVAEWTLDQYDEKYFSTIANHPKDPLIKPTSRHPRTLKGGNFQDDASLVRSSARLKSNLDWNRRDPQIPRSRWWNADAPFIGFRVVRPEKKPSEAEIEKFYATYLEN